MLASAIRTGDRGATGTFETLPRVLPGPRGNKEWYLCAARAGLLIGVAKPPQICQPRQRSPSRGSAKPARNATIFTHNGAPSAQVGRLARRKTRPQGCARRPIVGINRVDA